jgi:hypothetical protein
MSASGILEFFPGLGKTLPAVSAWAAEHRIQPPERWNFGRRSFRPKDGEIGNIGEIFPVFVKGLTEVLFLDGFI